MKKILTFLLLFTAAGTFAQIKSFKGLVLPDVELQRLSLSTDMSYSNTTSEENLDFPVSAQFGGYINHRYRQTFYNAFLTNTTDFSNNDTEREFNNFFGTGFSFDHTRYNKDYYFFRLITNTDYRRRYESNSEPSRYEINNNVDYGPRLNLSVGKGRIEPLDWALRAAFMNRSLVKSGAIADDLSEDVILEVARTMAVQDRIRFFDQRFYNIRRVKAIDSIMAKNNVDFNAVEFYTTINDQYFFAPQRNVFSGSRIELTGSTTTEFNSTYRLVDTLSQESRDGNFLYNFQLSYQYYLPQNLFFHHSFRAGLNHGGGQFTWFRDSENERVINDYFFAENISANLGYTFNWFPNTRTSLTVGTNTNYEFLDEDAVLRTSTRFRLFYFINRRLAYNIDVNFNYLRERVSQNINEEHGIYLGGRITYQVF